MHSCNVAVTGRHPISPPVPPYFRPSPRKSVLCHSTRTEKADKSLESVLKDAGIELSVLGSVRQRAPDLSCISVQERVEPLLQFLQHSLHLQPQDLQLMLLRCPRLLAYSMPRQVLPAVEFLRDLGFSDEQVASTLKRFPQIMGYGVKSHLVPHCHYLKSLGISSEELPRLILSRPQVLGTSIELVITYLRKWLRIERSNVGRLLWSYPLDYSLPRVILPVQEAATDSSLEEDSSNGAASTNASISTSSSNTQDKTEQPQGQPLPPLGSAERCTWLDIDLRKKGDGSSGKSDGGDDDGSGGDAGDGSNQQPPSAT